MFALLPLAHNSRPIYIDDLPRSPVVVCAPGMPKVGVIILVSVAAAHAERALEYHRASSERALREGDLPLRGAQVCAPQFPADSDPTVQMLADEVETLAGYKVELFTSSLAMLGNGRPDAPLPSPQAHLIIWFQKYRPKFKPASTDDVLDIRL